ncbi:hypothetical protein J1614_011967 [Plenodomus biglobosus]|nr:hypothetical protein J1614_011967 [Plenodomus biglobosus]
MSTWRVLHKSTVYRQFCVLYNSTGVIAGFITQCDLWESLMGSDNGSTTDFVGQSQPWSSSAGPDRSAPTSDRGLGPLTCSVFLDSQPHKENRMI